MPTKADETNFRRFSAGAISGTLLLLELIICSEPNRPPGMISVFFTYPLELIRVRMAFESSSRTLPSLTNVVRHVYTESVASQPGLPTSTSLLERFPVLKFYRGFIVTITGMVPYAGTSFLAWGYLRSRFMPSDNPAKRPTPFADLGIGAASGVIAQTVSYPFEVIRRRMQIGGIQNPDRWVRWGETVSTIWKSRGWRGFYVGLGIGYLKVVPMTGISFAVWQSCKRLLDI